MTQPPEQSAPQSATTTWHDAGPASLPPARIDCRTVAGQRILVARDAGGAWFAVAPDCSHANLSLAAGRIRGTAILCPHHGARFDLATGCALGPPASAGIATWPIRITADRIEVCL